MASMFNHFAGSAPDEVVDVWEDPTRWYTAEMGVDNSTLLRPIDDDAQYAVVNFARLPTGPIRFMIG